MKRLFLLSLLAYGPLAAASDLTDRLFDQLKTELRAEAKAGAEKGDQSGFRFQEMLLQLPRNLALGSGRANTIRSIDAIANFSTSDKVQEICKALSAELLAEQEKREKESVAEMETAFGAAIRTALAAKASRELDQPLVEVARLSRNDEPRDTENAHLRTLVQQGQQLSEFLRQWQDYLAQTEAGNAEGARQSLQNLTGNTRDFSSFIPRSELLARLAPLVKASRPPGQREESQLSVKEWSEAVSRILTATKGLEGLNDAVQQIEALEWMHSSAVSSKASQFLAALKTMQRTYQDVKNGLASRISISSIASSSGYDADERLGELQAQLAMFALPRILGLPENQTAQPGENIATFLQRILEGARKNQDWPLVGRVIEVAQSLNLGSIANTNDSSALRSYLAGWNQEQARQWALAVSSYQAALKTGSQIIAPSIIGERLETIQKSNPAEFAQGMQLVLTPPPAQDPRTIYESRYGRPGYPASMPFPITARPGSPAGGEATIPVPAKVAPDPKAEAPKTSEPAK